MIADSDVVIRFLTNDDPKKAQLFENFLNSGQKVKLTDVTLAEIYWTLRSFYKFSKPKTLDALESLIAHSSIQCSSKVLQKTLDTLRVKNVSFIDAYEASVSQTENDGQILSFDRDFDKFPNITRVEP